jgi:uncharacterized iron-regulated membrane protein
MSARDAAATGPAARAAAARGLDYRTVWRWHFYAGLFCIPFVLWLSVTGSIYLFKPQIEAWLDRPYDHLAFSGPPAPPSAQVRAALAAVPGAVLNAYELPSSPQAAARVLVGKDARVVRVYVHPQTLAVLHAVDEDARPMRTVFRLHGELMLGDRGSMLVELAASWTILMLLSGLYLWWPRGRGVAGVLYPRLGLGGRALLRDLHAVVGFWVAFFALFLLVSGLPWAKSWGGLLKDVRSFGSAAEVRQDWATGSGSELALRRARNAPPAGGMHEHGHGGAMHDGPPPDLAALDRLVPAVQAEALAPPVLVAPPSRAEPRWSARSEAQNRPLRASLELDGERGAVLARTGFAQRPWIDRAVGIGVAAHEGQLFGWPNQALGAFTALGLITVAASALVLWWRRRPSGRLGAPPASGPVRAGAALLAFVALMGVLLPLFGASLLAVLALERLLLRRSVRIGRFLGLRAR